jgi:hypothetical protein
METTFERMWPPTQKPGIGSADSSRSQLNGRRSSSATQIWAAFRRALKLVTSVEKVEQEKFWGFALSIMFACCLDASQKKAVSALSTHWKRLLRTEMNSAWAANAWQEGANPDSPIMLPPSPRAT